MLGPKQRRLASYVASANDEPLDSAGQQWKTGEGLLRRVATQLQARSTEIGTDDRFSGESAKAASQAFAHSAKKMADRADEMREGAGAFHEAATPCVSAKTANQDFAKHAGDQPPPQPFGPHRCQGPARLEDPEQPVLEPVRRPRDSRGRRDHGPQRQPHDPGCGLREDPRRDAAPAAARPQRRWPAEHDHPADDHARAAWGRPQQPRPRRHGQRRHPATTTRGNDDTGNDDTGNDHTGNDDTGQHDDPGIPQGPTPHQTTPLPGGRFPAPSPVEWVAA